jgi:CRP/FNR family cyclic AMP-dependent transcriptional regulator
MTNIDMRTFARSACPNVTFTVGDYIFRQGEAGSCLYIIQSGLVEMRIGEQIIAECGPNDAIGFMPLIDGSIRTSSARVKETAEVSLVDDRKFRFMIDELPNFSMFVMNAMAARIRQLGHSIY